MSLSGGSHVGAGWGCRGHETVSLSEAFWGCLERPGGEGRWGGRLGETLPCKPRTQAVGEWEA